MLLEMLVHGPMAISQVVLFLMCYEEEHFPEAEYAVIEQKTPIV